MTHPLRVAANCTTHPLHKAQNLMTHPLSAPAHPRLYFLTSPLTVHNTIGNIVKASVQVKMSFISTCLRFDVKTTSLPSRNICGSYSTARRFVDTKSANSTNWSPTILDTNLEGIGACPGPSIKAFSDLGDINDLRLGRLLVTVGDTKGEGVGATRWAELVTVIADTDVNVSDATEETPSLVLALGAEAEEYKGCGILLAEMLGTEEEMCEEGLLWIDEMMGGIEFPIVQTTASVRESAN